MITILLQKILAALTQLLGDIKTKLNTIKDNLDDLIVVATASGPIASFSTTITKPLISCKVEIKPKQASGTPTPSNPLPISGTDTIIITQTDGDDQVITAKTVSLPQTVYGGEVDVIGGSGTSEMGIITYNGSEEWTEQSGAYRIAAPADCLYDGGLTACINNCNMFTPQKNGNNTIRRGQTNIVITTDAFESLSAFKTYLASLNLQVIYPLATPTTITLANPIELTAINGVNNVFGDTDGNTSVQYLKLYKED